MNIKSGAIDQFKPFSQFQSLKEFNHHMEMWLLEYKYEFSNKRQEETTPLDFTFTNDRVPQPFVQLVKCFFPEARTIEEYWRMTKIAAYRNNREKEKEQVLSTSIQAFKQLVNKLKAKKVSNPIAYYYGILNKKFTELYFEELFEMESC